MTSEVVLKALDESIEKWRKIATGRGENKGAKNCALCQLFNYVCQGGCPVMLYTGRSSCEKTPYYTFVKYCDSKGYFISGEVVLDDTSAELALVEMNFLILVKKHYEALI